MRQGDKGLELVGLLGKRLQNSYGWDRERSMQVAEIMADEVFRHWGGQAQYIPKRLPNIEARVAADFNGRNITELSRRYGISARTIRRYLMKK
jgi:Mor family transcriptional regulator